MNTLPDKLIFEIFTHLDQESFLIASTVCKRWNIIISENIDFFSTFYGEKEDLENDEGLDSSSQTSREENSKILFTPEQLQLVTQINQYSSNQHYEMLGVSPLASEDEIRAQYKKLAMLLHPDKNKAPGSIQAFQSLKKSFDSIMSDCPNPDDGKTSQIDCPNASCGSVVYVVIEKLNLILAGYDIGQCRVCKQNFGKVYCPHCFCSWTMTLIPEYEGTVTSCTACFRPFVLQFPKAATSKQLQQQKEVLQKRLPKKRPRKNWWQL